MRAVDVGVGHDDDLVIAQLFQVEIVPADSGAKRLDQRPDFLGCQHPVDPGALHVQDLALPRQDRLRLAVAALLGATASGLALHPDTLAIDGITRLAKSELYGKRGDVTNPHTPRTSPAT